MAQRTARMTRTWKLVQASQALEGQGEVPRRDLTVMAAGEVRPALSLQVLRKLIA